jgi:uncharacterized iron-regulated membrane protein
MTPKGLDMSGITDQEKASDLEVFVDPQTGAVLGERHYQTVLRTIHGLHEELLIPNPGQWIIAATGLALLVSVILGVVIWWRQSKGRIGAALTINPRSPTPRLMRELHTVIGIFAALFLCVQALSGSLIDTYFPVSHWITTKLNPPKPFKMPPKSAAPPITANQARDIGVGVHPASDAIQIVFPVPMKPTYSVRTFPRDEVVSHHLRQVMVSGTGRTLFVFDPDKIPMPSRVPMAFTIWIHNGQFWGLAGRWVTFFSGLALTLMFPTGFYMWWRRQSLRNASAQRKAAAA